MRAEAGRQCAPSVHTLEVREPGGTAAVSTRSVPCCSWLAEDTAECDSSELERAAPFHLSSLKLSDFMFSVFYLLSMNGL